ncbi:MAG TPA: hypothetical protein VGF49_14370 [Candidatus Solibacter sp.]
MFGMSAVLVYLLAMGIPLLLLRFHSVSWYWYLLAVVVAMTLGFIPMPAQMQNPAFDLVFGFVFIALLIWGVCGLLLFQVHRGERHA